MRGRCAALVFGPLAAKFLVDGPIEPGLSALDQKLAAGIDHDGNGRQAMRCR